jgi:acetyl esterase/lipase
MTPQEFIELPPVAADETVAYGPDPMHVAEFFLPAGAPRAWLLTTHGGFWRNQRTRTHMTRLCRAFNAEGLACCNISYRRAGDAGGGWPATFHDVLSAADFLYARVGPFTAVGFSAGGHLTLRLAAERPWLRGALALAPVGDVAAVRALGLGEGAVDNFVAPDRIEDADPMHHAPLVRTTVIHGTEDDVLPIDINRGYARRTGARLIELAGVNHLDLINPESAAWPAVRDAALAAALAPGGG